MLSHGHWDHGGAMLRALELMLLANGGRPVPTYMHPAMYATRAMKAPDDVAGKGLVVLTARSHAGVIRCSAMPATASRGGHCMPSSAASTWQEATSG